MKNSTSIVAQKNQSDNTIGSGERDNPYTNNSVDNSWGESSLDNFNPTQVEPAGEDVVKSLGLKKDSRISKLGTKEFYIVDSQGKECVVEDSRSITSMEQFSTEVSEINECFGINLSIDDVAKLINKKIDKLKRKAHKKASSKSTGEINTQTSGFSWDDLKIEREFSQIKNLSKYQRLVLAKVPDDVIYRLIFQGDKEGEITVDTSDPEVNAFHRFAHLWIEACLTLQEDDYWTPASPSATFIEICKEEIRYNSRTGEYEWLFNNEILSWGFFISEVRNKMLASISNPICPLAEISLINKDDLKALAEEIVRCNQYNPITEWAEQLPEWDGRDRYSEVLELLGQEKDNEVALLLFEWMKAAMNRFLVPGSVNELIAILKGKQGSRKTSFVLALMPYSGTLDSLVNNAENIRVKHKLGIAELGEFNGMLTIKAVEAIKREASRTFDPLRPLYVNTTIDLQRAFSYIGTINNENFFNDSTGNRRFFVLEIPRKVKINVEWLDENREQLWSQIRQDSSLKGWLDERQENLAAVANKNFTRQDDASEFVEWFCEEYPLEQLQEGRLTEKDSGNHALRVKGFLLTKIEIEKIARKRMLHLHGNEEKCDKQFFKNIEYLLTGKGFSYRQHRVKEDAFNAKAGSRARYYRFEGGEII